MSQPITVIDPVLGRRDLTPADLMGIGQDAHIAAAATTLVKSGAGVLLRLVINKAVVSSVITIYDSLTASGTIIGIITQPGTLLANQQSLQYGVQFAIGLTIVTSADDDITVVYA